MSNRALKTKDSGEHNLFLRQLKSSSALTFARSLFHAAEGKELFEDEFVFASAVSTYYSLFHLGAALMLAYFSQPVPTEDPHTGIRKVVEDKWRKGHKNESAAGSPYPFPDPARGIRKHENVHTFLQRELREVSESLGRPGQPGTLRDMREFANYAPRMVSDGRQNVLYSGCQYEAQYFKRRLKEHLDRLDGFFHSAVQWMSGKGHRELVLDWDFVLWKFMELGLYHPEPVVKRAWEMYRSICKHAGADWRTWPGHQTWHMDKRREREERLETDRYAEAVRRFES